MSSCTASRRRCSATCAGVVVRLTIGRRRGCNSGAGARGVANGDGGVGRSGGATTAATLPRSTRRRRRLLDTAPSSVPRFTSKTSVICTARDIVRQKNTAKSARRRPYLHLRQSRRHQLHQCCLQPGSHGGLELHRVHALQPQRDNSTVKVAPSSAWLRVGRAHTLVSQRICDAGRRSVDAART